LEKLYMNKDDLLFLADYTAWANGRLLEAAARLPAEQFSAPHRTTYGSLRDGRIPASFPTHAEFPDLAAFAARFHAQEAELRAYLESLSELDLLRPISYTTSKGVAYTNTLWQIFAHLFNHATQHRSEAAEVLTEYSCSPGDLDLIWYLRQLEG
jgi:uncharacterized damage-inducible protein DinB